MKMYPEFLDVARNIEGTVNSAGVHPAGIVICKNPIDQHIPLRESKGQICSQFDGPEVEELGLLKFDLLGVKTLTVINETFKTIKERHGIDIDLDSLEPNDKKVFDILEEAIEHKRNLGGSPLEIILAREGMVIDL
jgi:DNA polymerase-3 subunit alpha